MLAPLSHQLDEILAEPILVSFPAQVNTESTVQITLEESGMVSTHTHTHTNHHIFSMSVRFVRDYCILHLRVTPLFPQLMISTQMFLQWWCLVSRGTVDTEVS
jgi:hypothetical protein